MVIFLSNNTPKLSDEKLALFESTCIDIIFVVFMNALTPIVVTDDDMVKDCKLNAELNAFAPILVTSVPMDTDLMLLLGMLLGSVRVPNVAAVVCVVPSVRVKVVVPVEPVGPVFPVEPVGPV